MGCSACEACIAVCLMPVGQSGAIFVVVVVVVRAVVVVVVPVARRSHGKGECQQHCGSESYHFSFLDLFRIRW
jgi:hypothetical protein